MKNLKEILIRDLKGNTPLHIIASSAAGDRQQDQIEILLQHDAYRNEMNEEGKTPLMLAAEHNHVGVATKLLTAAGKNALLILSPTYIPSYVNTPALHTGQTALHFAATHPASLMLVKVLCQYGADVRLPDNLGYTALQYAQENSNEAVVQFLENATLERAEGKSSDE